MIKAPLACSLIQGNSKTAENPKEGISMDANSNLKQMKILLVDDDEIVRNSMRLAFQQKGLELETAANAEDGLRRLQRGPYDIIISDLRLPGMNGLEFLKRADGAGAIKLLISAYGDHDAVAEAYAQGITDFLPKPFSMKTLWATLNMHMDKRATGRRIIDLRPRQKIAKDVPDSVAVEP